jgi:3-hydroxyacyl-[acyl-carrier-protein] dehydratase
MRASEMQAAGTPAAGSFCVSADHPCLPGHFLGGSIVPGVVLLDEAFALILAANPGWIVVGLPSVKFVRPVLPAQLVTVSWHEAAERRIAFACAVAAQTVLHGSVLLGPPFGVGAGSHAADPLSVGPVPSGPAG